MLSGLLSGQHYAILMLYFSPHYNQSYNKVLALREICFYSFSPILRTTSSTLSSSITFYSQLWQFPFIYQLQVPIPVSIDLLDIDYYTNNLTTTN